jgi:hypothetical protein
MHHYRVIDHVLLRKLQILVHMREGGGGKMGEKAEQVPVVH